MACQAQVEERASRPRHGPDPLEPGRHGAPQFTRAPMASFGDSEAAAMPGGGGGIGETAGEARVFPRQKDQSHPMSQYPAPDGSVEVARDLVSLGPGLQALPPDLGPPPARSPRGGSLPAPPLRIAHRGPGALRPRGRPAARGRCRAARRRLRRARWIPSPARRRSRRARGPSPRSAPPGAPAPRCR